MCAHVSAFPHGRLLPAELRSLCISILRLHAQPRCTGVPLGVLSSFCSCLALNTSFQMLSWLVKLLLTYTHAHTHIHPQAHTYIHPRTHTLTSVFSHMYMQRHKPPHIHSSILRIHTHTLSHTYTHDTHVYTQNTLTYIAHSFTHTHSMHFPSHAQMCICTYTHANAPHTLAQTHTFTNMHPPPPPADSLSQTHIGASSAALHRRTLQ